MHNILVVEDSPLALKILENLFQQEASFEPVFCASLAEAQVMLETSAELFFAAVVDLNLPDAPNGESVDLVLSYHLPCIVVSGSYNEQQRNALMDKGIVDYVLKETPQSYQHAFRLLHRLERNVCIKVMVADDSSTARGHIRRLLEPHRYQILEATNGKEALRLLNEQSVDLLLLDNAMPELCGIDLVKLLRQRLSPNDLLILGLCADNNGSLSAQFIKHGADDFLRKPFSPEELSCRVTSCLERRDMIRALKHTAEYDLLTQLRNRRSFCALGQRMLSQARQEGAVLSVAMLDIDHFKRINDTYGHAVGDRALALFSCALAEFFPTRLSGRLGGEEFALIAEIPAAELKAEIDQLRQHCASLVYADEAPALSFSAGVVAGNDDLDSMLHQADRYLYQAKQQGRAQTVMD